MHFSIILLNCLILLNRDHWLRKINLYQFDLLGDHVNNTLLLLFLSLDICGQMKMEGLLGFDHLIYSKIPNVNPNDKT